MPDKIVQTTYPLIDADPHASRVIRYFRLSDYAVWAGSTGAFPGMLYAWGMNLSFAAMLLQQFSIEMADSTHVRLKTPMKLGGLLGFLAGFMFAYQRSSSE
jgi:hypothetical protein